MYQKTYVYPNEFFHLTRKRLGKTVTLLPSQDYMPKGVSFSPTIENCLEGVPFYYTKSIDWKRRKRFLREGKIWYVYTPASKVTAVIPNTDDLHRTHEARVLNRVKAKLLGKIRVSIVNDNWAYQYVY